MRMMTFRNSSSSIYRVVATHLKTRWLRLMSANLVVSETAWPDGTGFHKGSDIT
jgi:hypothetical protein